MSSPCGHRERANRGKKSVEVNDLGLSELEERLYLGLLADRWTTADDFASHVDIDEMTAIRSLDRLVELGLVAPENTPRTVPPQVRYARLIADAEMELQRDQADLARAKRSLAILAAEQNQLGTRESLISLSPIEVVRARLRELADSAELDVLSVHPGNAHQVEAMEASKPLNRAILKRGVGIRCLYQTSITNDRRSVEYGRWMLELGGEVRTVPVVAQQMIIVDRKIALIPIDARNPGDGALEVQHPSVLSVFVAMFEQSWAGAAALAAPRAEVDLGLSEQERELLRLFVRGHSDQSAARILAVSLRTVRRMVAALCERMSAHSRFELGARAAQLGVLDDARANSPAGDADAIPPKD